MTAITAGSAAGLDNAAEAGLSKAQVWMSTSTPLAYKARPASAIVMQSKPRLGPRPGTSPGKQSVKVRSLTCNAWWHLKPALVLQSVVLAQLVLDLACKQLCTYSFALAWLT